MRVTRSLAPPLKCPHMLSKPGSSEERVARSLRYRSTCSRVAQASSVAIRRCGPAGRLVAAHFFALGRARVEGEHGAHGKF